MVRLALLIAAAGVIVVLAAIAVVLWRFERAYRRRRSRDAWPGR